LIKKRHLGSHVSTIIWWEKYGTHASRLQHLEKCILSQGFSASICEQNWSTIYIVQTKKRKRSLMQQMKRIVFVQVNLIEDLTSRVSLQELNLDTTSWNFQTCWFVMRRKNLIFYSMLKHLGIQWEGEEDKFPTSFGDLEGPSTLKLFNS
jgi:hypothetical protein